MQLRRIGIVAGLLVGGLKCFSQSDLTNEISATLPEEHRKWIAEHPHIRVGITPDFAPFSYFTKEGKAGGVDVEILALITKRTGLQFDIVPTRSWDETLRLAEEQQIDVTTGTAQTPEREKLFHFTESYFTSPVVIVSRERDLRFQYLALLDGATLALPQDHVTTTAVMERLPNARIILTDTFLDSLKLVSRKKADATVANMIATSKYFNQNPELKLAICGVTKFEFPLRLAVRREAPVLAAILNDAVKSIPRAQLDEVAHQQFMLGLQSVHRGRVWRRRLFETLIVAVIIAGLLLLWNRLVAKEVRGRRRAEKDLREINQSLEVFSYAISHDLRAPLRAMSGFTEALSEDYEDKFDPTAKDYVQRIRSAIARMDHLISDVLAYSKAASSQMPIHAVALDDLVRRLIEEFPQEQRAHLHIDSQMPPVLGNPALLEQCISNLLGNALKFMPHDRVPEIHIRANKENNFVKLWVEDNGIGIAPEDQQRIFKMFERAGTRKFEGSGIGLGIAAKAIERMGGSIGVESELGKGSRFWIQLPAANTG
jgi:signal transduction histidine kinase